MFDIEDVRHAALLLNTVRGRKKLHAILAKFQAKKCSDVPEMQRAAFIRECVTTYAAPRYAAWKACQ